MPRVNLVLTIQPSGIESFIAFKRTDGIFIPNLGAIDTGAEVSLFPIAWLKSAEHKVIGDIELEQAGIAKQAFKAVEAEITVQLEDLQGNISPKMQVRAWFAETDRVLIGFQDILDRATLYADFLQSRTGYLEIQENNATST